ncbi:putative uncharacterized protein [Ruminococcus sp. CAG:563]|nr:putative uncharacterized protein [Ruminococcus sp. CAG:563]
MIHNECRLNELVLAELLKEEIENVALCVTLLELNIMLLSELLCLCVILDCVKINACIFLNGICHCESLKRLAEVDFLIAVCDGRRTANLGCKVSEHALGEIHHSVIIGICLIKLHESELGVMSCVHTLVTENTADLINSLHAADDKALKVKLKRNSELEVLVE